MSFKSLEVSEPKSGKEILRRAVDHGTVEVKVGEGDSAVTYGGRVTGTSTHHHDRWVAFTGDGIQLIIKCSDDEPIKLERYAA